jgi:hypothetical protein
MQTDRLPFQRDQSFRLESLIIPIHLSDSFSASADLSFEVHCAYAPENEPSILSKAIIGSLLFVVVMVYWLRRRLISAVCIYLGLLPSHQNL